MSNVKVVPLPRGVRLSCAHCKAHNHDKCKGTVVTGYGYEHPCTCKHVSKEIHIKADFVRNENVIIGRLSSMHHYDARA